MQARQIVIEISTSMLTHALHNGISALMKCPDFAAQQLVTDISIAEILASRGDDPDLGSDVNIIGNEFKQIEAQHPEIKFTVTPSLTQPQEVHIASGSNTLLTEPNVFFLVSGTSRLFTGDDLDKQGTSQPQGDPFLTGPFKNGCWLVSFRF